MLGNKQDRAIYSYDDDYMYFSFGGVHSSKYHLFIQNTKELTIENSISPTSEYTNAMMQEGTYYLGTSRKQKTFKRKCAAKLSGIDEYRRMMKWLTVGTTGELIFDSDIYWGWSVVLDTVGDSTFAKRNDFLFVEFEITFKTIGTYLAHSVYPATWIQPQPVYDNNGEIKSYQFDDKVAYSSVIGTNKYGIPTVLVSDYTYGATHYLGIHILDICNEKQDFILDINPGQVPLSDIRIDYDARDYLSARFKYTTNNGTIFNQLEYDSSKSTFYIDGEIAEDNIYCASTSQPNGILNLKSKEPCELNVIEATVSLGSEGRANSIILTLDEQSWSQLISKPLDYICFSIFTNNAVIYGKDSYNENDYTNNVSSYVGLLRSHPIGSYTISEDGTHKVTITTSLTIDNNIDLTNCKLYAGNLKQINVLLGTNTTQRFPCIVKVISYNNL